MFKNIFKLLGVSFMFTALITSAILTGCQEEDFDFENDEVDVRSLLDIRAHHDDHCAELCDSISVWASNNELLTSKPILWRNMIDNLVEDTGLSESTIVAFMDDLGMDSTTWVTSINIQPVLYDSLPSIYQDFVDDIDEQFMADFEASDSVIVARLDSLTGVWNETIDSDIVEATIEIAKSSCIYWKNNFDSCVDDKTIGTGPPSYRSNREGAGIAATGDVTGDLWGGFLGSAVPGLGTLAGALTGAVGGTLGAAIGMVIWG